MKSFLDRADRITYSNNNDSTLELNLQQRAFQCQQNGEIDQACELYKTAYNEMLMKYSIKNFSTNVNVDEATSDYCQMLEICCRHDESIILLRSTLLQHNLPQPSLCSVLLLKLLYIRPSNNYRTTTDWEEMEILYRAINSATDQVKKCFRLQYKSHWAYFTMIQELFQRERRSTPGKLKIVGRDRRDGGKIEQLQAISIATPTSIPTSISTSISTTTTSTTISTTTTTTANTTIKSKDMASVSSPTSNEFDTVTSTSCISSTPPLFFVGDSHIVSLAHRRILGRISIPFVTTGLKAWHVHRGSSFFTGANFTRALEILDSKKHPYIVKDVVVSAGEIDCREGFHSLLPNFTVGRNETDARMREKYPDEETAVSCTIQSYIDSLISLLLKFTNIHTMYILPVLPYPKKGKKKGERIRRKMTIIMWNQMLRQIIQEKMMNYEKELEKNDSSTGTKNGNSKNGNSIFQKKIIFLDIKGVRIEEGGVLRDELSLDGTHGNAKIVPFVEDALRDCMV